MSFAIRCIDVPEGVSICAANRPDPDAIAELFAVVGIRPWRLTHPKA